MVGVAVSTGPNSVRLSPATSRSGIGTLASSIAVPSSAIASAVSAPRSLVASALAATIRDDQGAVCPA